MFSLQDHICSMQYVSPNQHGHVKTTSSVSFSRSYVNNYFGEITSPPVLGVIISWATVASFKNNQLTNCSNGENWYWHVEMNCMHVELKNEMYGHRNLQNENVKIRVGYVVWFVSGPFNKFSLTHQSLVSLTYKHIDGLTKCWKT